MRFVRVVEWQLRVEKNNGSLENGMAIVLGITTLILEKVEETEPVPVD